MLVRPVTLSRNYEKPKNFGQYRGLPVEKVCPNFSKGWWKLSHRTSRQDCTSTPKSCQMQLSSSQKWFISDHWDSFKATIGLEIRIAMILHTRIQRKIRSSEYNIRIHGDYVNGRHNLFIMCKSRQSYAMAHPCTSARSIGCASQINVNEARSIYDP